MFVGVLICLLGLFHLVDCVLAGLVSVIILIVVGLGLCYSWICLLGLVFGFAVCL